MIETENRPLSLLKEAEKLEKEQRQMLLLSTDLESAWEQLLKKCKKK